MKKYFLSSPIVFLPSLVFAQAATFKDLAGSVVQLLKGLIAIVFAALAVGLLYGVVRYFANSDNPKERENIRGYLIWGVIGIAVAFGLWGIISILCNSLDWCVVGIPYINKPS